MARSYTRSFDLLSVWLIFLYYLSLAPQRDAVGHPGALEVVPQLPFFQLAHVELIELLF